MMSVVICTYNRCGSLQQTLGSLAQMSVPHDIEFEIIVVDNNSTDSTKESVEAFARTSGLKVRYVFEGRQGLSHARNAGIGAAQGEIIAFTDDDVTVHRHWLTNLREAFKNFDCIAAGGRIVAVWPGPKPDWLQEDGPYALARAIVSFDLGDEVREIKSGLFGANMAFRNAAFVKYGLFRTDLGRTKNSLMSWEETELFSRLSKGGERIVYAPQAKVSHPVAKERAEKSYFRAWYFDAGRIMARLEGSRGRGVRYFGVPRHLFRSLLENFANWMLTLQAKRRFYYKLQVLKTLGEIAETRKIYSRKLVLEENRECNA